MTNTKFKEVKQGRGGEKKGGEGKIKKEKDKERTGAGKSDSRKGTGR